MAKAKSGGSAPKKQDGNPDRMNAKTSKAWKKRPKIFDPVKRRLVTTESRAKSK